MGKKYRVEVEAEIFAEDLKDAERTIRAMYLKAPEPNQILLMEISEVKEEDGENA